MPRGKNYVNNNRGVCLQAKIGDKGGPSMRLCEYGIGCQRPDCIYRHEEPPQRSSGNKKIDVCMPFLAGKCTFTKGCRKRHPSKENIPRLLAMYKKTRCRFRDECYTEGCLFLHPNEERQEEPSFIAPHHFPPLSDTCTTASSSTSPNDSNDGKNEMKHATTSESAWKKNSPNMVADLSPRDHPQGRSPANPNSGPSPIPDDQQPGQKQTSTAWGHPDGAKNGQPPMATNKAPLQQSIPQVSPSQDGYYGGPTPLPPTPPMMVPHMAPPIIDPNTGYPMDPSMHQYYDQQLFYYHQQMYHQQMGYPYPVVDANGMPVPDMGIPFNVEAEEFIPGTFAA